MHFAEVVQAGSRSGAPRVSLLPSLGPGLAMCGVASAAAAWLSEHYGFPIILLGLLVGLSLNFVGRDPRTHKGLDLASRTCLRFGIVLLGLQVTAAQIGKLGPAPFAALVGVMTLTFLAGLGARGWADNRAMPGSSPAGRPRSVARVRRSRSMA